MSIKELYKYNTNYKPYVFIYTDGACINNGKNNAVAGYGIHYSNNHLNDIAEPIIGDNHSNNIAELTALIVAIKSIIYNINKYNYTYGIFTDSEYALRVIYTFEKTYETRIKKNKDIPNINLVIELHTLYEQYKDNIKIFHIDAHTGKKDIHSIGNEKADELAKSGIYKSNKYISLTQHDKPKETINKFYLNVPFTHKEIAKKLGATWDKNEKKWYYTDKVNKVNQEQLLQLFN